MDSRRFNPKAKSFSKMNLAYLSYCSNLVYQKKAKIKQGLSGQGFDLSNDTFFICDKRTGTQLFVVGDKKKIVISFRGTQVKQLADIATDLDADRVKWTKKKTVGTVHDGFYRALSSVWDELFAEVKRLRTNNQPLWITGHSLGAALAMLASATFSLQAPKMEVAGVYTFGQPRFGNRKFAKAYNEKMKDRSFRIVNDADVVTRVPPQVSGYCHVGTLKYFDGKGKLRGDKKLAWWGGFWDRLAVDIDDIYGLRPEGISDHSMDSYQKLCERAYRQSLKKKS